MQCSILWFPNYNDNTQQEDDAARLEIALRVSRHPQLGDRPLLQWMLASEQYRAIFAALDRYGHIATKADLPDFVALLDSPYMEVRRRAGGLIRRVGDAGEGLHLVPYLESEEEDVARLARECLVEWNARDYFADLALALDRLPAGERLHKITSRDGEIAVVLLIPARDETARPVHAIEPGLRQKAGD